MKRTKNQLLVLAFLFLALGSSAQLRIPVTNNDLRNNLQKVISDFPKEFSSLKGEVVSENPQTVDYASTLHFEGAEENMITRYNAKKPIYSWQATMLTTESFDDAVKKYKWLFNQLKVMTVKMGDYSFNLDGTYDTPEESRKFCSSIFKLTPSATNVPKLKVEVSLQFYFPEWKVGLLVYEKEREDNEKGKTKDDE